VIEIRHRRPTILAVATLTVGTDGVIVAVFMTTCTRLGQATVRLSATPRDFFQNLWIDDILFGVARAAFSCGVSSGANEARQVVIKCSLVDRRKRIVRPFVLPVTGDALLCRDLEVIPPPLGEGRLNLLMTEKALLTRDLVRRVVAFQAILHSVQMLVGERQFSRGKLGRRDMGRASPDESRSRYAVKSHDGETIEARVSTSCLSTVTMSLVRRGADLSFAGPFRRLCRQNLIPR